MKKCSVVECWRPSRAKGLCVTHRKQQRREQEPGFRAKERKQQAIWTRNNLDRSRITKRKSGKRCRQKIKNAVFDAYGRKCVCCGESEQSFLTIDHKNGGGRQHRAECHHHLYRWLFKNNFPNEFQTLCWNCNSGREINGGICPHQRSVTMAGDILARGGRSATFGPPKVSQKRWEEIWTEDDPEPITNTTEFGGGTVAAEITRENLNGKST